jgi:DNA-directed RNA polymerase alpha subunit
MHCHGVPAGYGRYRATKSFRRSMAHTGPSPDTAPENDFRNMGMDIRVVNSLAAEGICTLADLAQLTESDLASIRGVGRDTRKMLRNYLKPAAPIRDNRAL